MGVGGRMEELGGGKGRRRKVGRGGVGGRRGIALQPQPCPVLAVGHGADPADSVSPSVTQASLSRWLMQGLLWGLSIPEAQAGGKEGSSSG